MERTKWVQRTVPQAVVPRPSRQCLACRSGDPTIGMETLKTIGPRTWRQCLEDTIGDFTGSRSEKRVLSWVCVELRDWQTCKQHTGPQLPPPIGLSGSRWLGRLFQPPPRHVWVFWLIFFWSELMSLSKRWDRNGKRNSATSAITSGPVWTWKHDGAGKKQQQKHATIHATLTTSGANVQKTGAESAFMILYSMKTIL